MNIAWLKTLPFNSCATMQQKNLPHYFKAPGSNYNTSCSVYRLRHDKSRDKRHHILPVKLHVLCNSAPAIHWHFLPAICPDCSSRAEATFAHAGSSGLLLSAAASIDVRALAQDIAQRQKYGVCCKPCVIRIYPRVQAPRHISSVRPSCCDL